jgi:hypothetical protein
LAQVSYLLSEQLEHLGVQFQVRLSQPLENLLQTRVGFEMYGQWQ